MRTFWIITIGLFAIGAAISVSSAANAQELPVILTADSITGEFVGKVNSNTDDPRIVRVCLYRIDANSPDPTAEFACLPAASGRAPLANEVSPSGLGMVFEIPFTTTLVESQDQLFTARNIALDPSGELMSDPAARSARIPGPLGRPIFVVPSP